MQAINTSIITVENVHKSFANVKAVSNLSFAVENASCFGLLGPNGAGKTTMMRILYGRSPRDRQPASTISVFGCDPAHDELTIRAMTSVVPQENNLDEELNVYQNLFVYSKFYGINNSNAHHRIKEQLAFMELADREKARIKELSGGMKRRLLIARALLNRPQLLILDEPTTGLDPQVRHLIWEKLRRLRRQGITILLTTHYMEEAFQICDRILIMHQGSEIMTGIPSKLLAENIEPYVLEILNPDQFNSQLQTFPPGLRMETTLGRLLFYARHQQDLKHVTDQLPVGSYYLRPSNLEDLFLQATGRGLHEN